MKHKILTEACFFIALFAGIYFWGKWVIETHSSHAIVSWDEGFHGGIALFFSESLRNNFAFKDYTYILNDFKNGIIWYLPLWWSLAGVIGAILKPSVAVYRFTTLIFSVFSIIMLALFVKKILSTRSALITATSLAFVPIFIVYSHLMMIEVPLLFSISLTLLFFYRYLTKQYFTRTDFILTVLVFIIGISTKVIAIAIIFGVIISYGLFLKLFFKKSPLTEKFYSKQTLYFLSASLIAFTVFRYFTRTQLNADLLEFHLEQAKQMSGQSSNILSVFLKILTSNGTLYLGDFSHMLSLTAFWVGSSVAYIFLKRSLLSFYLLIWIIVTYFIFSAVKPQAVQYLLSIFVPISILVGLFWGEFIKYRKPLFGNLAFLAILGIIVFLGVINLENTETMIWRSTITYQQDAALFIGSNAKFGDRVITTGDGTRFLVRLLGFDKKLQTINGAAPNCREFIQDSVEWAILDNGPQSPVEMNQLKFPNWQLVHTFPNLPAETKVLKNTNKTNEVSLEDENFIKNRCIRFFSLGKNKINIFATAFLTKNNIYDDLKINLKINPLKTIKELSLDRESLKKYEGVEQKYTLSFEQMQPNKPAYILFIVPKNLEFKIRKIEISRI